MLDQVRETIKKYHLIEPEGHVVLGLSGGPDSVCLFHVLRRLGYRVHAVHLDHQLRPETAQRDREFVEALCAETGTECKVFTTDCRKLAAEEKITIEEAGRKARYEAFCQAAAELASKGIPAPIAVAHHGDDQAETILLRILRGTGTDGLAGMGYVRREGDYTIIRPLLDVRRDQIEEYCRKEGLEFVLDETNESTVHTRNRIRLELLPLLRDQYNEGITDGLCRLAQTASEDRDYLWEQAEQAYEDCCLEGAGIRLDREKVAALAPAIRHRVMRKALLVCGLCEDVTRERLLALDEQMEAGPATRVIEMPHGYAVTFAFDQIVFRSPEQEAADHSKILVQIVPAQEVAELRYPEGEIWLDAELTAEKTGIPLEKLAGAVELRTRREGDLICLKGGTKKLKKLLGEMKIPADERDVLPVVAAGRWVLAVGGDTPQRARYADALQVSNKTTEILTVKFV